jgi:hypothetical protein
MIAIGAQAVHVARAVAIVARESGTRIVLLPVGVRLGVVFGLPSGEPKSGLASSVIHCNVIGEAVVR